MCINTQQHWAAGQGRNKADNTVLYLLFPFLWLQYLHSENQSNTFLFTTKKKKLIIYYNVCIRICIMLNIKTRNSICINVSFVFQVLSLRLGHDELIMSPTACDLVFFLLREAHYLQELYLLVRSHAVHHGFITKLLVINKLSHLKVCKVSFLCKLF